MQSGKLRSIDDLSESFINATFGSFETVHLGGIDEVSAISKAFLDSLKESGKVEFSLSNGTVLSGVLHKSLNSASAFDLVGRTLDLKSAYKQQAIALHLASLQLLSCSTLPHLDPSCSYKEPYLSGLLPAFWRSTAAPKPYGKLGACFSECHGPLTSTTFRRSPSLEMPTLYITLENSWSGSSDGKFQWNQRRG